MTVLFIVPNYFTTEPLPGFLTSLFSQTETDWRAVLVDNSLATAEADRLAEFARQDSRITSVVATDNVGYYNALAIAQTHLSGFDSFEQVWLCNPDLVLDPTALETSLRVGRETVGVGVLAPCLVSDIEGGDTNPFLERRPGSLWWWRTRSIFACTLISRCYVYMAFLRSKRDRPDVRHRHPQQIYAAHGGCIIFLPGYFRLGGSTTRSEWLFLEEFTVAETCRRLGLAIRHEPNIVVRHIEHASTGTWRSSKLLVAQREAIRSIHRRFAPW